MPRIVKRSESKPTKTAELTSALHQGRHLQKGQKEVEHPGRADTLAHILGVTKQEYVLLSTLIDWNNALAGQLAQGVDPLGQRERGCDNIQDAADVEQLLKHSADQKEHKYETIRGRKAAKVLRNLQVLIINNERH